MGRVRKNLNFNDLFLEGQNDLNTRMMLIRSPLFGIAANMYNRAKSKEKEVRIGFIDTHEFAYSGGLTTVVKNINIVTPQGISVAMITNGTPTYDHIGVGIYGSHTEESPNRVLSSSNPKYVQAKMSPKSEHDAALSFDRAVENANNFFGHKVRSMLDSLMDSLYERTTRAPSVNASRMEDSLATFFVKASVGEVSMADMPSSMRVQAESLFREYREKRSKFDSAIVNAKSFMDGEKWFYVNGMNKGVVLGTIKPDTCVAALSRYSEGMLPYHDQKGFNYAPDGGFKWYPSFDAIPDDTRKQLEFSMVMLKTHRNSNEMLPKNTGGEKFWVEMGCFAETSWNDHGASVYVFSK